MNNSIHSTAARVFRVDIRYRRPSGFALVVTVSLMVLITILAIGMLSLASIELRKTTAGDARRVAMGNARLGLMLALGELQKELGDDRRVTADASILAGTKNPHAVGVWKGWSPDLAAKSASAVTALPDYSVPKGQSGFRGWLVSDPKPATSTALLNWHTKPPETGKDHAELFTMKGSGFDLGGNKVPIAASGSGKLDGTFAWAVSQENTKARINTGADDTKRSDIDDRLQAPARPGLGISKQVSDPGGDWTTRSAKVISLSQAILESGYGLTQQTAAQAARDFTVDSASLLTDPVKGGLKVDLSTGFEMSESDFASNTWERAGKTVNNPFRSATPLAYKGQKPLFQTMMNSAQVKVLMNYGPASVNHQFQVNGVPTFETLRSHYRIYRHLYSGSGAETAFERPFSHVATPEQVPSRPFGRKSQPSLAPVLDRMNLIFSIYAKSDGTLGILLTPFVTVWNPYNVDVETEGLVVYPWIDLAVWWEWNVTEAGNPSPRGWYGALSQFTSEGYEGSGRSSRPFFYLHLTQSGSGPSSGASMINPPIRLAPGEVRVFCLSNSERKDLNVLGSPQQRTWQMKPVSSASDITASVKGGIVLDMTKALGLSSFNYKLKTGDRLNSRTVKFSRDTYYYIVNMADAYQIKNPGVELMVEGRAAGSGLPALPAEKNLVFYSQVHSGVAYGQSDDSFSYPSFSFDEIKESPKMVGSLMTYHRVARTSNLPLADLTYTVNPRQPFVNAYLSGAQFQSGPHYESSFRGGTSLASLAMETTTTGQQAFWGASHSAASGRSHLPFFEVPRTPILSLGAFQHCDITATAFSVGNQIANSWASPYLSAAKVSKRVTAAPGGEAISPDGMAKYDYSYLANEALFDRYYFSGAAPEFGPRQNRSGAPSVWDNDMMSERKSVAAVIKGFLEDPTASPLHNPRMKPYLGGASAEALKDRIAGPARCVNLAGHLMVEGGFNINSTSIEAWTAVLASLRGVDPASGEKTPLSRFRHILKNAPVAMAEDDPWTGFRTLSDGDLEKLATNLVAEIKLRGPFLSLGEFVNRRITTDRSLGLSGAIQAAIDKSGLNQKFSYGKFNPNLYPNPENIPNPNTGTNTPGWLSQADLLNALAPFITPRSDTFVIRSMGEAKDSGGRVIARVRLEAVVQRVPNFVDPTDVPATEIANLLRNVNKTFGRRFEIISIKEIASETVL